VLTPRARRARARIGVIEAHELFGLDPATGEHRVGAAKNALWKARPGFTFVEIGLHALKRVEVMMREC